MRITELTTLEDRLWFTEVHLKLPKYMASEFVIATLHGNEDCPQKVELFKKDHYRCIPSVFEANENGTLVLNKDASKNAGKHRPKTDAEKKAGCL